MDERCFVIMPFRKKWSDRTWTTIKRIFVPHGMPCVRADAMPGGNIITDILEAIKDSAILVVDLTDSNPNVLFELGCAYGLGRNPDSIVLLNQRKKYPFDLQPMRQYHYTTTDDGYSKLARDLSKALVSRRLLKVELPYDLRFRDHSGLSTKGAFLGVWKGVWYSDQRPGQLDHWLVVDEVWDETASVVYSCGDSPEWNVRRAYMPKQGRFHNDSLLLKWHGVSVRYDLETTQYIKATRRDSRGPFKGMYAATLSKVTIW